jgi:subtilisin family serine protease
VNKNIFIGILFSAFLTGISFSQTQPKKIQAIIADSVNGATTASSSKQNTSNWSFLSLGACHVDDYLKAHPTYDGRGTIIAILDDGVDPGIAGLIETSEGRKKIIDVQDFAGTGDLYWQPAERDGDKLNVNGRTVLIGLDKINISSYDGKYYFANLSEKKFQNGLTDLNFNQRREDNFGVLIFQNTKDHWVAVVDGDGDSSVENESILSNFKERQDIFHFRASKSDLMNDGRFLTGGVNIFPDEKRINIYFADGGHGTHVAGIAGGYRIDGQTGFNGVAPGAEMIVLKFADNTMDGVTISGSMKHAYEYVVKVAQETGKPVIANMSFGIGSEIEGKSVMDEWLDSLLGAHPEVTVCISAGNDGPGLSNIGLPGSARTVITSGAALPAETARDLFALKKEDAIIWDFSSRGGELAKPDIVSPGTAISTVPDYVFGDRYNGTSMSSPYTTGCCAILLSGMKQLFPDYVPNANDIKRALQLSGTHFQNATLLDEGGGMINVSKAFDYLVSWQKKNYHPRRYEISVPVPNSVKNGTAAYYRNGFYPKNGERTVFSINPIEQHSPVTREKVLSFNAYDLRSNVSWLEPVQSSVYHRGEGSFQVSVNYDQKQLEKPGIYCGKISAYPKGTVAGGVPEFELWNTVIIPHKFSSENSFTAEVKDIKIKSGKMDREFFMIPAGTRAVKVSLNSHDLSVSSDAVIVNNDGRNFSYVRSRSLDDDESASRCITGEEVLPGVWEIDIKRGLASDDEKESTVDLRVEVLPIELKKQWLSLPTKGIASGRFEMTNGSATDMLVEYPRALVTGYERLIDTIITEGDSYIYQFKARSGENNVVFDFGLSREDYDLFTDISLQILRTDESTVFNGGFDLRDAQARTTFGKNDSQNYILKFRGGLADPDKRHPFRLIISERRELETNKNSEGRCKISNPSLSPAETEYLDIPSISAPQELPSGYHYYGEINFHSNIGNVRLPISFSP